jgi:hypothetical protein
MSAQAGVSVNESGGFSIGQKHALRGRNAPAQD